MLYKRNPNGRYRVADNDDILATASAIKGNTACGQQDSRCAVAQRDPTECFSRLCYVDRLAGKAGVAELNI